jgi:hypothetical protein
MVSDKPLPLPRKVDYPDTPADFFTKDLWEKHQTFRIEQVECVQAQGGQGFSATALFQRGNSTVVGQGQAQQQVCTDLHLAKIDMRLTKLIIRLQLGGPLFWIS